MNIKKYILIAAIVLLCLPAQADLPAADPPVELREWCHIERRRFAGGMSFLPDFDTSDGGHSAIAISNRSHVETWYLENGCDTTDHFNWRYSGRFITRVDLDNDGAYDYIDGYGTIHKGIANGRPPEDDSIARYRDFYTLYPIHVADINRDGYDDVLTGNQTSALDRRLFSVLFGGPDLRKLRLVQYEKPEARPYNDIFIDLVRQPSRNGKVCFISQFYEYKDFSEYQALWFSYRLREIDVRQHGDSLWFELSTLDSLSDGHTRPGSRFDLGAGAMHRAQPDEPELLLAPTAIDNTIRSYAIENGSFVPMQTFSTGADFFWVVQLNGSLNDDDYVDWFGNPDTRIYFYAGMDNGEVDSIPFAYINLNKCGADDVPSWYVIRDVTGDGVNDFAVAMRGGGDGCFTIYEGISERTVGVTDLTRITRQRPFAMEQNYPHPAARSGTTHVALRVQQAAVMTLDLYTLNGRCLGRMYKDYLIEGTHTLTIDLESFGLSPGLYVLRLSDGEHRQDRGMFVE